MTTRLRRYAPHRGAAAARAFAWAGRGHQAGWCLRWALYEVLGVAPTALDATTYWREAETAGEVVKLRGDRTSAVIPPGALVIWEGGTHGHAAIMLEDGLIATTDLPVRSRVGIVPLELVHDQWGYNLAGYVTTDGNGWILA